jgi:hypothetical protein
MWLLMLMRERCFWHENLRPSITSSKKNPKTKQELRQALRQLKALCPNHARRMDGNVQPKNAA